MDAVSSKASGTLLTESKHAMAEKVKKLGLKRDYTKYLYFLDKDVPYYLVLLTEPRDGLPFDYNQIRLFSWNAHKHRYETAYRQRNIFGMLPVSVGKEIFEKLGEQPTFTIRVRDDNGGAAEQKYRLEGVIVKRVLAPGETPVKAARAIAMGAKRKPLIAQP